MAIRWYGDLGGQVGILARCDGNEDLEHNERIEREVIRCDVPAFIHYANHRIYCATSSGGGPKINSELNCRCRDSKSEATTCPRIALLCLPEVSISMVIKIDHHIDR